MMYFRSLLVASIFAQHVFCSVTETSIENSGLTDAKPLSISAIHGSRFQLSCDVPAESIYTQWSKNGIRISNNESRLSITPDQSLSFSSISKADEGLYECSFEGEEGSRARQWQFHVEVPARIKEFPTSQSVTFGDSVEFSCEAIGDPLPNISWFRDGKQVTNASHYRQFKEFTKSDITFLAVKTENITCRASNMIGDTERISSRSFIMSVYPREPDETKALRGYCSLYNGFICKSHLAGVGFVWFNVSDDKASGLLNEEITKGIWETVLVHTKEPCKSAAEKLLCHYAFPHCRILNGNALSLPLCYEDCIAVRQSLCFNEWSLIEEDKKRGVVIGSRGHFRLPQCETLPRVDDVDENGHPKCSHAGLTKIKKDQVTKTCLRGNGRFYLGEANITKQGIPCQSWNSQSPHSHNRPPPVFEEMKDAKNYCRNPGGEEPKPWCYTMDPIVRWQHCDIPYCPDAVPGLSPDIRMLPIDSAMTPAMTLLLSGVGCGALLFLFLVFVVFWRFSKQRRNGYHHPIVEMNQLDIDVDKLTDNVAYHPMGSLVDSRLERLEYPRNDIIYIRDLGQGAFGRVFQAKAPNLAKGEEFSLIAVKMLKEEATEDLRSDFEREACILAEFDHPHIVKLLGVCAIGKPMCLLFEYMACGDLNEYLRSHSPNNYIVYNSNPGLSEIRLSVVDLTRISRQIASGMVYLSERGFVHRDLATRNCLVSDVHIVKIADFGLSQKLYMQPYYKGNDNDAIPVRWMPLESLLYNRYTTESDVWAFGVCLWEIYSFAVQPYYGMTHEEVVRFLQDGNSLQKPQYGPPSVFELMKQCWRIEPTERPTFPELYGTLVQLEREFERCLTLKRDGTTSPAHI
ncbi:tyrosine-protein kinase transmembrane receptor Ror2-like isoform X2 [Artemia franciscana]|uniref:tyrosine-protein kinase transmembrane receptor Ror2-like isoform X2 n=1 Tax=Artemia franciscana TaxID=6661 RepID=UPI0032DAE106